MKPRLTRRRIILLIMTLILAFTIVEAYAHTYVHGLSTVSETEARAYMMKFTQGPYSLSYYNTSQIFSRTVDGASADWFVALWGKNPMKDQTAWLYIFKTRTTGNPLVQDLEVVPLKTDLVIKSQYREEGWGFRNEITYNNPPNYTVVYVPFDMNTLPRTYYFNFSLTLKVYAKTLLGYIPIEETTVPINVTVQLQA